jgi:hypothetical protein
LNSFAKKKSAMKEMTLRAIRSIPPAEGFKSIRGDRCLYGVKPPVTYRLHTWFKRRH